LVRLSVALVESVTLRVMFAVVVPDG